MTRVLEFLLGVDRVRLGEGRLELAFLSAWPAWAAFLALVVAALYVWNIYRRETVELSPLARGFLVFLRCFIILLVLGMIFEPVLVLIRNDIVRSSVVVLVDHSASMTVADAPADEAERKSAEELLQRGNVKPVGPYGSRFELLRAGLNQDDGSPLRRLAQQQRVFLYGFDEGPQLLQRIDEPEAVDEALKQLNALAPEGQRTALVKSLETVLNELAGQTLTGLVVLTDGRSTLPADSKRLEELARARDLPLLTVGLGSPKPPNDAELRRVTVERRAFVNEDLPVRVELANVGFAGRAVQMELQVKGREDKNISQTVILGESGRPQTVELHLKPDTAGKYEMTVYLRPLAGEFDEANNTSLPLEVEVIDRKLKVLLVEDLPRWEYHYLKSALYRDETMLLSVVLNTADPQFAPEGSLPIAAFPATRDALFEYDVVIIGDVNRRMLSTEQMKWLEQFVREKGGGLVFIAGERLHDPNGYVGTPLEPLLPIEVSDEQLAGEITGSFRPEVTIEGAVSPILRFERDLSANSELWQNLPGFYWYYRAKAAKPGAQVLLAHPDDENPYAVDGKFPIMVLQRVGAGQVFFSGSDDTWRWRYYTGQRYFNTFWIQLIRYLALPQEAASIEPSSLRYSLGETAKLQMRVADKASLPADANQVKAAVSYAVPGEAKERTEELQLLRTNPRLGLFEGEFTPERTGKYTVSGEVTTTRGQVSAQADFVVAPSREEFLDPTRDDEALKSLAALAPNSRRIDLTQLPLLADMIPSRNRTLRNDLTDEIWDSPLALMLLILALSGEWILRKKYRML